MKFFRKKKKSDRENEQELITSPYKSTKKNIHEFFKSIRNFENKKVLAIINDNPEFIFITRPDLPKKDNGQTGLKVSLKIGNFEIAETLIHKGADLNFIEKTADEWNSPVLHQAIKVAIFHSNTLRKEKDDFEKAFKVLSLMLSKGANPNGIDSYGNSCLFRAFLDSHQMIDHPNFNEESETLNQLKRVFDLLIEYGADKNYSNERREKVSERIVNFGYGNHNWV